MNTNVCLSLITSYTQHMVSWFLFNFVSGMYLIKKIKALIPQYLNTSIPTILLLLFLYIKFQKIAEFRLYRSTNSKCSDSPCEWLNEPEHFGYAPLYMLIDTFFLLCVKIGRKNGIFFSSLLTIDVWNDSLYILIDKIFLPFTKIEKKKKKKNTTFVIILYFEKGMFKF